jgi:hypothetical protein
LFHIDVSFIVEYEVGGVILKKRSDALFVVTTSLARRAAPQFDGVQHRISLLLL